MSGFEKKSVTAIFTKGRVIEIPFFQRSYVWGEENWERFLDDMTAVSDEQKPYFMGALILKQKNVPTAKSVSEVRLLIDGQQRLTTIVLFFKAVSIVQDTKEQFRDIFYNLDKRISLQHNHNDTEIFEAIVEENASCMQEEKHAKSKILECYNFFMNEKETIKKINTIAILNNLHFVGIDLGPDEDEQQIFDTINSLGVDLTTAELLKNELFGRGDEELFDPTWKKVFEGENKEFWDIRVTAGRMYRHNIDMLLQAYLLICSRADKKYVDRIDSLFKSYKAFIADNSIVSDRKKREEFIHNLMGYAEVYRENINSDLLDEDINKDSPLERMNLVIFGLNTTTVIPYLLYILKEADDDNKDKIFSLLESYIVRRAVCKETSQYYNKMFASFIRNGIKDYDSLREKICRPDDNQVQAFPNNESFKKGFDGSTLTNQQAKTVLYLIEKGLRDEKHDPVVLLGLNKYSLEHVMPKKWRNHWDDLDKQDEQKSRERDRILLKLGNLTIITSALNISIRDSNWERKKEGSDKRKRKGLIEYSKPIRIFAKYLDYSQWNEDTIKERADFLFEHAQKTWPDIT